MSGSKTGRFNTAHKNMAIKHDPEQDPPPNLTTYFPEIYLNIILP